MKFVFEVSAKIETAKMDGTLQYTVQGRLIVDHDDFDMQGEPLNMGIVMPHDLWQKLSIGDTMEFPYI